MPLGPHPAAQRGPTVTARAWSACCCLAALAEPAAGQDSTPAATRSRADKSAYTLWHPTPATLMRELAADRPDRTESPYTVDAGHFQVEMDLFGVSRDQHNPERANVRRTSWSLGPVNLKLGLANRVDAQLLLAPYTHVRTEGRSTSRGQLRRQSGYGDTTVRTKINLWGNDGGPSALAAIPFITFPTAQDDLGAAGVRGGLLLPFGFAMPWGFEGGAQTGMEVIRDTAGDRRSVEVVNSLTVGRALTSRLGAYVEFWSLVSTDRRASWQGTVDFGLSYQVHHNLRLDAGVNVGVTRAADDWAPFCGLTWRY